MGREERIREILIQLRGVLEVHREMGFDPPPVAAGGVPPSVAARSVPQAALRRGSGRVASKRAAPPGGEGGAACPTTLEDLRAEIGECTRCKLQRTRTHLVFGEGASGADLVFVGEGPGREEDLSGRPFVGAAGELLTKIIAAMGLTRDEVYICNVVKCRPPGNRDPEKDEVEACRPFLKRQLDILRPKAICVLGRVAGQSLLGPDFKISSRRGRWHRFEGIPLMPTFHPAYLLRNPAAKRQVWEDVQKIMGHLGLKGGKNG